MYQLLAIIWQDITFSLFFYTCSTIFKTTTCLVSASISGPVSCGFRCDFHDQKLSQHTLWWHTSLSHPCSILSFPAHVNCPAAAACHPQAPVQCDVPLNPLWSPSSFVAAHLCTQQGGLLPQCTLHGPIPAPTLMCCSCFQIQPLILILFLFFFFFFLKVPSPRTLKTWWSFVLL